MTWAAKYLVKQAIEMPVRPFGAQVGGALTGGAAAALPERITQGASAMVGTPMGRSTDSSVRGMTTGVTGNPYAAAMPEKGWSDYAGNALNAYYAWQMLKGGLDTVKGGWSWLKGKLPGAAAKDVAETAATTAAKGATGATGRRVATEVAKKSIPRVVARTALGTVAKAVPVLGTAYMVGDTLATAGNAYYDYKEQETLANQQAASAEAVKRRNQETLSGAHDWRARTPADKQRLEQTKMRLRGSAQTPQVASQQTQQPEQTPSNRPLGRWGVPR